MAMEAQLYWSRILDYDDKPTAPFRYFATASFQYALKNGIQDSLPNLLTAPKVEWIFRDIGDESRPLPIPFHLLGDWYQAFGIGFVTEELANGRRVPAINGDSWLHLLVTLMLKDPDSTCWDINMMIQRWNLCDPHGTQLPLLPRTSAPGCGLPNHVFKHNNVLSGCSQSKDSKTQPEFNSQPQQSPNSQHPNPSYSPPPPTTPKVEEKAPPAYFPALETYGPSALVGTGQDLSPGLQVLHAALFKQTLREAGGASPGGRFTQWHLIFWEIEGGLSARNALLWASYGIQMYQKLSPTITWDEFNIPQGALVPIHRRHLYFRQHLRLGGDQKDLEEMSVQFALTQEQHYRLLVQLIRAYPSKQHSILAGLIRKWKPVDHLGKEFPALPRHIFTETGDPYLVQLVNLSLKEMMIEHWSFRTSLKADSPISCGLLERYVTGVHSVSLPSQCGYATDVVIPKGHFGVVMATPAFTEFSDSCFDFMNDMLSGPPEPQRRYSHFVSREGLRSWYALIGNGPRSQQLQTPQGACALWAAIGVEPDPSGGLSRAAFRNLHVIEMMKQTEKFYQEMAHMLKSLPLQRCLWPNAISSFRLPPRTFFPDQPDGNKALSTTEYTATLDRSFFRSAEGALRKGKDYIKSEDGKKAVKVSFQVLKVSLKLYNAFNGNV